MAPFFRKYAFLKNGAIVQDGIFPIGLKEHLLIYVAGGVGVLVSTFIVLIGMALFQRKWPIRAWITGVLIGLLFIGFAVGGALAADVVPQIRDRYNANIHTTSYTVQPFAKVNLDNAKDSVEYEYSPNYSVGLRYFGNPDLSSVTHSVSNGTLTINSRQFDQHRACSGLCIPSDYNMTIIVRSPHVPTGFYPDIPDAPMKPMDPDVLQN
jgi:hypothetical protein